MRAARGLLLVVLLLVAACQRAQGPGADRGGAPKAAADGHRPRDGTTARPQTMLGLKGMVGLGGCGRCHAPTAIN